MQNERGEQCNHDGHGRRDHAVAERAEKLEMAFRLSGKLQPAFGRGALPDGQGGVRTAPCEPTNLAGIQEQPRASLYPFGR